MQQPPSDVRMMAGETEGHKPVRDGDLELEDGYLSKSEVNAILRTLAPPHNRGPLQEL